MKIKFDRGGGHILGKAPKDDLCCTGERPMSLRTPPSQTSPQYCLSLSQGVSVPGTSAPLGLGTPAVWELLWAESLSQFRPVWTSQAALRRKSKLTASPPLTKTHSSWRALVCSRSPCHHPLSHSPCPLHPPGHADSSTWSLSTHRSSCHPPWGVTHQTHSRSPQGRGSSCSWVPAGPEKMIRTAMPSHSCCWSAGHWHLPKDQPVQLQTKGRIKFATLSCHESEHHS